MRNPILKTAFFAGLAAGFACFLYLVFLYTVGANPFGRYKYIYLGLYAIFFATAFWYYRFKINSGHLSTGRAIGIGLLLNPIATSFYGFLLYGWMLLPQSTVIERHQKALEELQISNITFLETQMKAARELEDEEAFENLEEQKKDIEAAYKQMKETPLSAGVLAVDQAFGLLITGFFLAFLVALIFKTN
ncbi:MAG: DUF4199 domain-containing protein [Bacteroidota bacterium]